MALFGLSSRSFTHKTTPLLALASLCALVCTCGRYRSDHAEAARLMEDRWDLVDHYLVLPIGEVQIVNSKPELRKGQASLDDVHVYEVLVQEKAVNITSNVDLTNGSGFSWNNWFSLTQQGVVRKLSVNLVARQEGRLRCPDSIRKLVGAENLICVEAGAGKVREIVRSQKFQIGTKQYWLIMGNHSWKWSETARKTRDAQRKTTSENMKFMAIAQYEDFTKKWQLSMIDYAPRDGEFAKQQEFE